jgi:hypothetical protein
VQCSFAPAKEPGGRFVVSSFIALATASEHSRIAVGPQLTGRDYPPRFGFPAKARGCPKDRRRGSEAEGGSAEHLTARAAAPLGRRAAEVDPGRVWPHCHGGDLERRSRDRRQRRRHSPPDGENGFLVSTVDQAAERIVQLLRDTQLRQRLGHRAKETVRLPDDPPAGGVARPVCGLRAVRAGIIAACDQRAGTSRGQCTFRH